MQFHFVPPLHDKHEINAPLASAHVGFTCTALCASSFCFDLFTCLIASLAIANAFAASKLEFSLQKKNKKFNYEFSNERQFNTFS